MGWRTAAERVRKSISARPESLPMDDDDEAPMATPSRLSGAFYIPNAVAQRASAYMRPDEGAALRRQLAFDALALVRRLPLAAYGYMLVRRDVSRLPAIFRSQWLPFWGELRGGMLLLFDADTPAAPDAAADSRPVRLVFSATKCLLDLKNSAAYSQIKLRRNDGAALLLRFADAHEAQSWVAVLQTKTAPYVSAHLADFEWIVAIGKGASGKVFLVKDRRTDTRLALKVVDKSKVFRTQLTFQHVINERLVLEMCDGCPFLIQLRYAFQTDLHLYFATDFYDGGDVFSLLQANKGRLSERHARRLLAEVTLALEWLHKRNIVYRDLKPENVVLDGEGHVRLADFGLAKVLTWPENHCTTTICGTTAYAAPEMLQSKPYNVTLDLWCLGVFMYHILMGRTPFNFRGRSMEEMEEMQRTKQIRYSSALSLEAVALMKALLQNDPHRRPSLEQVKKHRFFADVDWVRVEQKEAHADGLGQFVADKTQKESIFSKLSGTRAHVLSHEVSSGSIVHSDGTDLKSSALDRYLLRNINAEEWRNVSFSEDDDVPTVTEFPALFGGGRAKCVETWAIAGWAWMCHEDERGFPASASPIVAAATSPTVFDSFPGHNSFGLISSRRSMQSRRVSRAVGERAVDAINANSSAAPAASSYTGRPSLHEQDTASAFSTLFSKSMRRSFRRRREAWNGNSALRHHSTGHEHVGGRFSRDGWGAGVPTGNKAPSKLSRVLTQSEKRSNRARRQSQAAHARLSQDYSVFHRPPTPPQDDPMIIDRIPT